MPAVAVVTGANKGIGFYIAKGLLSAGCTVILACRDAARGEAARKQLVDETRNSNATVVEMDIASTASVSRAVATTRQLHPGGIDILVNNAGFAFKTNATEPFGLQARETLAINYFGTQNAMRGFISILNPTSGRIVNVSSRAGLLSNVSKPLAEELSDPRMTLDRADALMREFIALAEQGKHTNRGWANSAYGTSKIGENLLTKIFAREFPKLKINSCCPGWCRTDMAGDEAPKSAEQGADTPLWLALDTSVDATGRFFAERHEISF